MTTNFVIEKGIPKPEGRRGLKKYPFGDMEIGDSFFVPSDKYRAVINASQIYGKRWERKFSVAKVDGGARCWRIA
jgi:hypothetical protein